MLDFEEWQNLQEQRWLSFKLRVAEKMNTKKKFQFPNFLLDVTTNQVWIKLEEKR